MELEKRLVFIQLVFDQMDHARQADLRKRVNRYN